jgi:hypothetical protein
MAHQDKGHLEVEDRGAVLIVRVDGGPHSLFVFHIAPAPTVEAVAPPGQSAGSRAESRGPSR